MRSGRTSCVYSWSEQETFLANLSMETRMLKQKYSQGTNNPEIKISWIAGEKSELENRDRKTSSQQNGGHISDSLFLLFPFFF